MKKLAFTFTLILLLTHLTFAQKKIEMVINEKYTFSLKNAGEYSGVLLENNKDYYLFENFSNDNKRTRLFKKDVRKVTIYIDEADKQKSANTFHKDSIKMYASFGAGATFGITTLGAQMNLGFQLTPSNNIEAVAFVYPGLIQKNVGMGLNYILSNQNVGLTLGLGIMSNQSLNSQVDILDLGIFKFTNNYFAYKKTESAYYKFGFNFNNKDRTWLVGIDVMRFNISEKERGGLLTLTVQKRLFL